MHRWRFNIVTDLDPHALLRVLQPFAILDLKPDWLWLSDQGDSFALSGHFDNVDDDTVARLLARLRATTCVRTATASIIGGPSHPPPPTVTKPH